MEDLNLAWSSVVATFCDNNSAIKMAKNLLFHGKTKHIEIHHQFICDKIILSLIDMKFCSNIDQVIDRLRKVLN